MYREELFSYSFLNVKNIIFVILLENGRVFSIYRDTKENKRMLAV